MNNLIKKNDLILYNRNTYGQKTLLAKVVDITDEKIKIIFRSQIMDSETLDINTFNKKCKIVLIENIKNEKYIKKANQLLKYNC
jgi:hypothetical protein